MILPKRSYNAIIVDDETYDRETLENWVWNFTAFKDMELNFRVGSLEIYNLNVWPNNGGAPTIFVSFRPMSVHRGNLMDKNKDGIINEEEYAKGKATLTAEEFKKNPYTGITPILDENKVKIFLDNNELKIISVTPYPEFVLTPKRKKVCLTAYIVQALIGKNRLRSGIHSVRVIIEDELQYDGKLIKEKGEASYFWVQEANVHHLLKYKF